ncbi:S-layer homology domain-containing protein [Metabacillus iocasae]|uniref:SLH domain-containing protein n=1 Tax=Priestia iocasae TaxID=2291674 RepID=A0ABS2QXT8_9BACI|nr:S-layer homology domain-containing protein [Metabacillus iocasae]MBM7703998.1 hypothetical protein [Metabacillus iocasae]
MAYQPKSYRKFVAGTVTAAVVASALAPVASAASFSDVDPKDSHAANIEKAVELGLVKGKDGKFMPYETITRGQVVKILARQVGDVDTSKTENFEDVVGHTDAELVEAALKVKAAGVFEGANGKLLAGNKISRQAMAKVLVRGFDLADLVKESDVSKVKDLDAADADQRENIEILSKLGITNQENFNPKGLVTRAQFATFIINTINATEESVENVAVSTTDAVTTVTADVRNAEKATVAVFANGDTSKDAAATKEVEVKDGKISTSFADLPVGKHVVRVTAGEAKKEAEFTVVEVKTVVSSVEAINAEEVLVTFNKDMSSNASEPTNYELKINGVSKTADIEKIVVKNKTALIRLKDGVVFKSGDKFVLQAKDSIKDVSGKQIERFASEEIAFNVTTAPAITKSSYNGDKLELEFNRPVNTTTTLIKLDGIALNSKTLVAADDDAPGNYVYTVTLTPDEKKLASKLGSHEVVIFDLQDTKGTVANSASVATSSYTVTQDNEAPAVKAVKALNANKFFIELSEGATTVTNASFTVKKGNYTFTVGGDNTQLATDAGTNVEKNKVYYEAGSLDGKPGYYVAITEPATGELNPLYGSGQSNVTLDVTFENYKDSSNFVGAKYQGSITLSKDTNKPAIEKTNIDVANKKLLVDFDGELDAAPASTDIVVRDKDGVIIAPNNVALGTDKSVVEITVSSVTDEPYTVEFAAEKVKYAVVKNDVSSYNLNANKNDKLTATVKSTANNFFKYVEFTAAGSAPTVTSNAITINYGVDMDNSALNVANYTLDGKALPTGTTIDFVGNKKNVKITLPKESFATTTQYKLTIKSSVTTKEGEYVVGNLQTKSSYETVLTLEDNVKPVLQEAKYVIVNDTDTTTNTLLVKFSEVLSGTPEADDFKVVLQGSVQTVSSISNLNTTDEYVVISLANAVNIAQSSTIEIVPEGSTNPVNTTLSVVDGKGNKGTGSAVASTTTKDSKGN